MENRKYSLVVGCILILASFGFFAMPAIINMDSFIPVVLAMVLILLSIGFFFIGLSSKSNK